MGSTQSPSSAINAAIDGLVKVTRIESVTATGAKLLTVKFNQAVDTTKATFAAKRASVTANVSNVVWNADNTEATLTLATKLVAGPSLN